MTIEARIHGPIIPEARSGVAERKSAEEARTRVPKVLEDLNGVYDKYLKKNKNKPTASSATGWNAIDLHVTDRSIDEEAHVRLVRFGSYTNRMAFYVDGLPINFLIANGSIELSTEQKIPQVTGWRAGNNPSGDLPFEKREPSGEEMGHIEDLVKALKNPRLTKICPHR